MYFSSYPAIRIGELANSHNRIEIYDGHLDFVYRDFGGADHTNIFMSAAGQIVVGEFAGGEYVTVDSTGISLFGGAVENIRMTSGGVVTIGATSGGNVYISASGIAIRDATITYINLDTSGNALFGRSGGSYANVYWNASNSRLEFRTNATVKSYIDTDGAFTIPLPASYARTSAIVFRDVAGSFDVAELSGYTTAGANGLRLWTFGQTTKSSDLQIESRALSTYGASLVMYCGNAVSLFLTHLRC